VPLAAWHGLEASAAVCVDSHGAGLAYHESVIRCGIQSAHAALLVVPILPNTRDKRCICAICGVHHWLRGKPSHVLFPENEAIWLVAIDVSDCVRALNGVVACDDPLKEFLLFGPEHFHAVANQLNAQRG